jgi:hypothetical protein
VGVWDNERFDRVIRAATRLVTALSCVAGVAAINLAVVVGAPAQASAATAYRYWALYLGHGSTWQYAQRGPASEYPADGDVEGWRFAIQTDAAGGLTPRDVPDFATLCATTPAKAGDIRVGLVIDFGVANDAPAHESPPAGVVPGCVYVHAGVTGAAVLEAATTVRIGTGVDAGLVCGIDGYPKTECAPSVVVRQGSTPTSTPTPSSRPTTTPVAARTPTTTASAASTVLPAPSSAPPVPALTTDPPAIASVSPVGSEPPAIGGSVRSSIAAPAAATSLAALKTGGGSGVALTAVLGGVLVVALGAAAVWRSRRGRR